MAKYEAISTQDDQNSKKTFFGPHFHSIIHSE